MNHHTKVFLSFLVYFIFIAVLLAATGYVVFWRGSHGAWFVLTTAIIAVTAPQFKQDNEEE